MRRKTKEKLGLLGLGTLTFISGWLIVSSACHARPTILDVAQYDDEYLSIINWEDTTFDLFIEESIQYKPLPDILGRMGIEAPKEISKQSANYLNGEINQKISYIFDEFDEWHAQTPEETIARGMGDCKAMAVLKYHVLKQLGYKNVKVITIHIPDGRGGIAGHAVTLLNDLWILDINYPYFYNFAYLRADAGLVDAYDEAGVRRLKHYGER